MSSGAQIRMTTALRRSSVLAVRTLLLAIVAAAWLLPQGVAAQPPRILKPLEDLTLAVDAGPHVVDLRGVYWGELEDCDAVSSDESVVTADVVNGYDLVVTPVGVGHATITASASNEYGRVEHDFDVMVVNVPPEAVGELPDLTVTVGEAPVSINLAEAFTGGALMFTGSSSAEHLASVSIDGYMATVTAVAAGTATVTLTASNSEGTAEHMFTVTVKDQLPMAVGTLSDLTVKTGDDPVAVDVAPAFSGTALNFSAMSSAEGVAVVSTTGATVTVTAVAAGTATVTVTATNSAGSAEQSFMVTVEEAPPVPPMAVGTLPDLTVKAGEDPVAVDVAPAFSGTALNFSAMSSAEGMAVVSTDGATVTVTAVAAGTATVTVTATNSAGSAEQSFVVTVEDAPPMAVGTLPDLTVKAGDDPVAVEVAPAFSGTALNFSAMSSADGMAAVSTDGATVTVTAVAAGTATVTVTATNNAGSAEQSFVVSVEDVPPMAVGTLPDLTVKAGDDPVAVEVAPAFSGTALNFSAMSSAEGMAAVSTDGATVTVTAVAAGTATVTVTAMNSAGSAEAELRRLVSVEDVPPMAVGTLPDLTVKAGDDPVAVEVAPAAFSGNGDGAEFLGDVVVKADPVAAWRRVSSARMAAVSAGATVTVTAVAAGTATVTVTAMNSAGSAEQSFLVSVEDVPPMAVGTLPDLTVKAGDDPVAVEVAPAFSGTALNFSAMSSADGMAAVSADGATVTVTAVAAGTATVTVTAMNSAGSAEQSFLVSVEDVPPMAVGTLPDLTVKAGDDPVAVEVAPAFSGTALNFSAMSSADGMAAVSADGATVTVTAVAAGTATVTVTAMNSAGSAEQSFLVSVEDVAHGGGHAAGSDRQGR